MKCNRPSVQFIQKRKHAQTVFKRDDEVVDLETILVSVLPKVITESMPISVKIPITSLAEIEKSILKFISNLKDN